MYSSQKASCHVFYIILLYIYEYSYVDDFYIFN